jgi:Family of unknown function (DUF6209)
MRLFALLPIALLPACSAAPADDAATRSTSAARLPAVSPAVAGDSADTACQVVLRHTDIDFESSLGPQTDCSSGTCWVVITVTFDVAMSQSLAQSEAFVLYQGEGSATWQQSPQAEPIFGCDELPDGPCAPEGFRRYQVVLRTGTFTNGPGNTNVSLIPYIQTVGGARLFDHNRVADPLGSYALTAQNDWTVSDDAAACPGPTPTNRLTATFATGWQNGSTGTLAAGGKLDVAYDIYRMPQTLGCTTDSVSAFATLGFVQFQPGGLVLSELLSGPYDSTTSQFESIPLEFDVPAGTTSAALWFMTSSDCTDADQYDSDYGQNYVFTAP